MDAVSYANSAKQAKRIKKFIAEPDSTSGLVSLPKVIEAGESITIPDGRVVVHPNLEIDGTLTIESDGELFVPFGGTLVSSDLMHPVDTIDDLRNETGKYKYIYVTGYHTKNDGAFGSHFYRLKGLKTTEADNSGTVIIVSVGGSDYVYELQYDGAVNVKWFGAKGDWNRATNTGTDDTDSIQSAFNAVPYGGSVKFPHGEYLISETLLVSRWCEIYGEGLPFAIQGVQLHTQDPDITMVRVQTETVNIHHIGFRGAGRDTGTGNGIGLFITRNGLDSSISHDHRFDTLWFNGFNNSGIYATKIQGSHFVNCTYEFCTSGIRCGDGTSTNLSFSNCIISNSRFYGNIKAINLYHSAALSMNASSISWNLIIGCVFDFNGNEIVSSSTSQAAIYLGDNVTGNTISGCSFSNQRYFDIYMSGNTGNVISGFNSNRVGKASLYINNCSNVTLNGINIKSANYLRSTHSEVHGAIEIVSGTKVIVDDFNISSYAGETRISYGVLTSGTSTITFGKYSITEYLIAEFLKGASCTLSGRVRNANFTPTIYGSVIAGTNTYSRANGFYRLTDDGYCEIDIVLILSAYDAATAGSIRIGGLPFTSNGTTTRYPLLVAFENSNTTIKEAIIYNSNNFIRLFTKGALDVNVDLPQTAPTNTFSLYISGRYKVDIIN